MIGPYYNTIVVMLGVSLLGACAGLIGAFAVLRQRALLGDALAHAALPGLCIAFVIVGHRNLPAMLLGALASGVIGILVITVLRRWTRVKEDAAIGIVLSVFFGLGVVISTWIQKLSTTGSKAGLDTYIFGKTAGMLRQDVYLIAGVSIACLVVVVAMFKEFKLSVFDPAFARSQGWSVVALDLALMTLIAVTVVIGLPAVGVVLMAALLILPATAARFWTDLLSRMLVFSVFFGFAIGLLGTMASAYFDKLPAGPVIVLVGTALFLISMLFAPRRGLVAQMIDRRRFNAELESRKTLETLHDLASGATRAMATEWNPEELQRRLKPLRNEGWVEIDNAGSPKLTATGLARAAAVVRGRRLWELFLTEHPDEAVSVANLAHESVETILPPETVRKLEEKLASAGRLPPLNRERP